MYWSGEKWGDAGNWATGRVPGREIGTDMPAPDVNIDRRGPLAGAEISDHVVWQVVLSQLQKQAESARGLQWGSLNGTAPALPHHHGDINQPS